MKRVALYNPTQINVFLRYGAKPVECVLTKREGENTRMGLVFEVDSKFEEIMKRWRNNEFKKR